jgi:hypothetical protein
MLARSQILPSPNFSIHKNTLVLPYPDPSTDFDPFATFPTAAVALVAEAEARRLYLILTRDSSMGRVA